MPQALEWYSKKGIFLQHKIALSTSAFLQVRTVANHLDTGWQTIPCKSEIVETAIPREACGISRDALKWPQTLGGYLLGVKTEKIGKGRIWGLFRAIWMVFLEILPLHKSKEKPIKT